MKNREFLSDLKIDGDHEFRISERPHALPKLYRDKADYKKQIKKSRKTLNALQEKMYAHDRYSLLCIFQAMDAAGKDGTIRAVMSGINPHGVSVSSFKRPSEEEIDHEFLWRSQSQLPQRGNIAVFNRSYYEEVLVVKVHPEIVTKHQRLPEENLAELWAGRYDSIRDHEAHLARNGTRVLKFFLNLSKEEQRRRFVARIDEQEKNWKFNEGDLKERGFWEDYQGAYEEAIQETARPEAPWFVIPADDKKNMRLMVAEVIKQELESMEMTYPEVSASQREEMQVYRAQLMAEET